MDRNRIETTKERLLETADILYQGRIADGMAALQNVISALGDIAEEISDEALQQRLLTEVLTPIVAAMEAEDGTLLADLITYELVELLETLI